MKEGALIMDDASEYELEEFTHRVRPDLVGAGIKEKYTYHKMGVPFRQMHSWDYSGPYHGFDGFGVFARDMDAAVNSPTWGLIRRRK
jgi:nitrogenase molybdenum-iron protein alpha chain